MKRFGLMLVMLALAVRLAVPTGWIPGEKSFQLTLCTGVDTETVWVDAKGKLHKQKPHSEDKQQPCAFGGVAALANVTDFAHSLAPLRLVEAKFAAFNGVAIGQGLAAPPPPQTGPPILT